MKRYIFKEQEFSNEYRYIFLCGSHYVRSNKKDKRNVLREFLKKENANYCPIISCLEIKHLAFCYMTIFI